MTENIAELPFRDGAFDAIWSEGAVCNIGLARGVAEWPRLPRPGGDLAQSELTRLTRQPTALEKRRNAAYPRSGHRGRENRRDRGRGSCLVAMFPPSQNCLPENHCRPMQTRFERFADRNGRSGAARTIVAEERAELVSCRGFDNARKPGG